MICVLKRNEENYDSVVWDVGLTPHTIRQWGPRYIICYVFHGHVYTYVYLPRFGYMLFF